MGQVGVQCVPSGREGVATWLVSKARTTTREQARLPDPDTR